MTNEPRVRTTRRGALIGSMAAIMLALVSAAPVLASRVPTVPEPPLECPDEFGSGLITKYVTTLTMPSDSTGWSVTVEVTLADEPQGKPANCELTLATYELPTGEFSFPQTLSDSDGGTFGAGTHTLTAALPVPGTMPNCFFQYDFAFGQPIAELTFEDRYGDRQIRSRIGPDAVGTCPSEGVNPAPPPSPGEGIAGGNPTPEPLVPDTSTTEVAAMRTVPSGPIFIGALVLFGAGGLALVLRAEAARARK